MSFALKATSTNVSVNSLGVVSRRCTHLHMLLTQPTQMGDD